MPTSILYHRLGDTFSWAGIVSLPSGNTWSAECGLRKAMNGTPPVQPNFTVPATLTLIGQNAQNPSLNDYTLLLSEDGPDTLAWGSPSGLNSTVTLLLAVKFYNTATPAVQLTTAPIQLVLSFDLVPHA